MEHCQIYIGQDTCKLPRRHPDTLPWFSRNTTGTQQFPGQAIENRAVPFQMPQGARVVLSGVPTKHLTGSYQ